MTSYFDSSALLKIYVDEPDSAEALALAADSDPVVVSMLTVLEVTRALGIHLPTGQRRMSRLIFDSDLQHMSIVAIDDEVWRQAAEIGFRTGTKSLDSLHIAAALSLGNPQLRFVTYDRKQALAARNSGLVVTPV